MLLLLSVLRHVGPLDFAVGWGQEGLSQANNQMMKWAFCEPVSSIHATSNTLIFLAPHAPSHVSEAYALFMTLALSLTVGAVGAFPAGMECTA